MVESFERRFDLRRQLVALLQRAALLEDLRLGDLFDVAASIGSERLASDDLAGTQSSFRMSPGWATVVSSGGGQYCAATCLHEI